MCEQACAYANREFVRVQITPETDEDDLIGGFRLIDGETVFAKGPVIKAMEAGAVLVIDEIDRGSNKLMCLQGVLEGKPVLIKKTGEVIKPAPGFNVIATANTKGQGDEAGRFIAATIIDDAFLERFTVTLEQPYPSEKIEKKIVVNHMGKFGVEDNGFSDLLVQWGQAIRKTFEEGGIDDIISTRRLCHIVQTYSIFGDKLKDWANSPAFAGESQQKIDFGLNAQAGWSKKFGANVIGAVSSVRSFKLGGGDGPLSIEASKGDTIASIRKTQR